MMNLEKFLKANNINFKTERRAVAWVKKLKANSIVRIGSSYFIDELEMSELLSNYFNQQISLRKKRRLIAKKRFAKKETKTIDSDYDRML